MRPLKFPDEVYDIYLKQCYIINDYITDWLGDSLGIKSTRSKLQISSNILKTLSNTLGLSSRHTAGSLVIDFSTPSDGIITHSTLERSVSFLDSDYEIEFNFLPSWFSNNKLLYQSLYQDLKSIDHTRSSESIHYRYISKRYIDINKLREYAKLISTDDVLDQLSFRWQYKDLSPVSKIVAIIHESLLELTNSNTVLALFVSNYSPVYPMIDLHWSFNIVPEALVMSYKTTSSSKDNNVDNQVNYTDLNVYILSFILKLNISQR
jgi:hypothetical protein